MNENTKYNTSKMSLKTIIQIESITLISNMLTNVFSLTIQLFYITVVLLPISLYMIAFIIYTVWNMFNDPLIGYFCDRSTRWIKKWGKRFPFVVIGMIGTAICFFFVYIVPVSNPSTNPITVFAWLLFILCIFDGFSTLCGINLSSFRIDKIRTDELRAKAGAVIIFLGPLGLIIAYLFQPLILESLGRTTFFAYAIMALFYSILTILILIFAIPGLRESQEMRERRQLLDLKARIPFFKTMKNAITQKSFVGIIIIWIAYNTGLAILGSALPFFTIYVLEGDLTLTVLPLILFAITPPLTIPIWLKLSKKWTAKNMFIIGMLIMSVCVIPFLWISDYLSLIICFIVAGFGLGCQGIMQIPIQANAIEEAAIKTGTRKEGVYYGIFIFFSRLSIAANSLITGSIFIITGFNQDPTAIQTPLALFGIRLLMSLMPAIVLGVGCLIFWKIYDITPEKRQEILEKLKELNL